MKAMKSEKKLMITWLVNGIIFFFMGLNISGGLKWYVLLFGALQIYLFGVEYSFRSNKSVVKNKNKDFRKIFS